MPASGSMPSLNFFSKGHFDKDTLEQLRYSPDHVQSIHEIGTGFGGYHDSFLAFFDEAD